MVKEVKYRDVQRFLVDSGWRLLRTSASHEIWGGPNPGERLSIPKHGGKVSPGVIRQVIKVVPNTPDNWR